MEPTPSSSSMAGKIISGVKRVRNPYLDEPSKDRGGRGIRQMGDRPLLGGGDLKVEIPTQAGLEGHHHGPSRALQVNPRQRGNPILKFVRNVPKEVTPGLLADFVMSPSACALFISLTFHLLRPDYLIQRIKALAKHFTLRVLLCLVDVEDNVQPLLEMNKMSILNDFTLVLAWTPQEAARYLETYKAYEHKPATSIQEKVDADYLALLQDCLGTVRSLNKSDVLTLASNFGSLKSICDASIEDLAACPGLGDKKVARIYEALHNKLSAATHKK